MALFRSWSQQKPMAAQSYKDRMDLIENVAKEACGSLWPYIFKEVTTGKSCFRESECGKEDYKDAYNKFFCLLHVRRG